MGFKPIRQTDRIVVVATSDPAIDDESTEGAEGLAKYEAERMRRPASWRDLLKFKDGERPTEFVIGTIEPGEMARISDECNVGTKQIKGSQLAWQSFLASVVDIRDPGFGDIPKTQQSGSERVDPKWLRETFVRGLRNVATEIGFIAWSWNQLTEDEVKN